MATVRVTADLTNKIKTAVRATFDIKGRAIMAQHSAAAQAFADESLAACMTVLDEAARMPATYVHKVDKIVFRMAARGEASTTQFAVREFGSKGVLVPGGLASGKVTSTFSTPTGTYNLSMYRYDQDQLNVLVTRPVAGCAADRLLDAEETMRAYRREMDTAAEDIGRLLEQAGTINNALKHFPPLEALLPPEVVQKLAEKAVRVRATPQSLDPDLAITLGSQIAIAKMRGTP